jgi:hypothetical protein
MKNISLAILLALSTLAFGQAKSNSIITISGLGCTTGSGAQSFRATSWSGAGVTVQGGAGIASNLIVDKLFDRCSITLFNATVRRLPFTTLTLTDKDATSGAATMVIQLSGVHAVSFQPAGNQNNALSNEKVTFSWDRVLMMDKIGGSSFCYDFFNNQLC